MAFWACCRSAGRGSEVACTVASDRSADVASAASPTGLSSACTGMFSGSGKFPSVAKGTVSGCGDVSSVVMTDSISVGDSAVVAGISSTISASCMRLSSPVAVSSRYPSVSACVAAIRPAAHSLNSRQSSSVASHRRSGSSNTPVCGCASRRRLFCFRSAITVSNSSPTRRGPLAPAARRSVSGKRLDGSRTGDAGRTSGRGFLSGASCGAVSENRVCICAVGFGCEVSADGFCLRDGGVGTVGRESDCSQRSLAAASSGNQWSSTACQNGSRSGG